MLLALVGLGGYLLKHRQLTSVYATQERNSSSPAIVNCQHSLSKEWVLMGSSPFHDEILISSILCR